VIVSKVWVLVLALAAVASAAGCDPEGPGASGVISLGPDVDASAFQSLAMRVFANPSSASFDPSAAIPHDDDAHVESLADIAFPFRYKVGGSIGTSDVATWMFVAWLSHRDPPALVLGAGIDPGDVFCAVPFSVRRCDGAGVDGYCAVTPGVDCTLTNAAP
jgi:hypothetical protein